MTAAAVMGLAGGGLGHGLGELGAAVMGLALASASVSLAVMVLAGGGLLGGRALSAWRAAVSLAWSPWLGGLGLGYGLGLVVMVLAWSWAWSWAWVMGLAMGLA